MDVPNPYRWQLDAPTHVVPRTGLVEAVVSHLQRGVVVKFVGGRGMGKSVMLQQVEGRFAGEAATRALRVQAPPCAETLREFTLDLAARLGVEPPPQGSMPGLMKALEATGVQRLVLLLDEADEYLLLGANGTLARAWFNHLEAARKEFAGRVAIVIAGGLGVLHIAHALGSGLLSRAEPCVARPFDERELRDLASPFAQRGTPLDDDALATLAALSGGNPALATYGMEQLWRREGAPVPLLREVFAEFPERHRDFMRAVNDAVSHRGFVGAPGRVLAAVRASAGAVPLQTLREACAGDDPPVDVPQAVELLEAAGLVRLYGSAQADPVSVHPVASILNIARDAEQGQDPIERLVRDVARALGQMHRFGRDFHDQNDLLQEQVFTSLLAVSLVVRGWSALDREAVQSAGYTDVRVHIAQAGLSGHVVIETKLWGRKHQGIQQQMDDYRVSDTLHCIAVVLGKRDVKGWAEDYQKQCLPAGAFTPQPTPADLVGHWRVERRDPGGAPQRTDHFLVQIPKRQ